MMSVLALPAFMGALILTTVVQVAGTAFLPIVPLYVQELLHTSGDVASQTGWLLAVSGIAAAIGSYSAGRLNRQFALRRLLLIFVGASAALLVPQAFVHNFMSFLVLRAAAAVAFGALFGLVGTLAAISSPRDAKGVAFGMVGAASSIGFGAGPLLGGGLAAAFGIRPLFIMSAILLASMPATLWLATMVLPSILARFRVAPRLEMRLREQR